MQSSWPVAALEVQDVKMVVVFVDARPAPEAFADLERRAREAGLEGNLVAVWPDEFGRTRFLAPPPQHPFFQAVSYPQLRAQISGSL
jgi:hypothetical protein